MRGTWAALGLVLLGLAAAPTAIATAAEVGLDGNAPIDAAGAVGPNMNPATLHLTGAKWVRVNFILGPWSAPDDPTLHNGKTWFQTYDGIIDGIVAKGLKPYALVGAEAVGDPGDLLRSWPGPDPAAAEAWVAKYTSHFVTIVGHFKDRVRTFESYNEPNDWAGGSVGKIHPHWFAYLLQNLYLEVKSFNGHAGDPSWQVTLVSGAVFTHDDDTGAAYLADTYWYGRNALAWDWTHEHTGSYPLDGVGMHLYVAQGTTAAATITGQLKANLDALWGAVTSYEGDATPKRIYVSEMSWSSSYVGEAGQAANVTTILGYLKSDARVQLALWFCLVDWPGADYGLYRTDWSAKPALAAFSAQAGPPVGSLPSKTYGAGPPAFGSGVRTTTVTPVNTWRSAAKYWGLDGIDDIKVLTDTAGMPHTFAIGLHQWDRAEYLMKFGGGYSRLVLVGIADKPGPVLLRVYVDGVFRGTTSWGASNNSLQSASLLVSGVALGTHTICVEFGNDTYTGPGDGDRNLYLEWLRAGAN